MKTATMAKGKGRKRSIGPAAKACKGKKKTAYLACVRARMKGR